jgi:hypothetical protein
LIPRGLRYTALKHGGRATKEVVCSSQIAMAFGRVRYPIQAAITAEVLGNGRPHRLPFWLTPGLRRSSRSVLETGIFTPSDPLLITPRDFDLSPYFEVVKFSRRDFDYKKIKWAAIVESVAEPQPAQPVLAPPGALTASKALG